MEPKRRVLVVDDEEAIHTILRIKLRVSGYEVVSALNGREALELFKSESPDIVLLDIIMPEMDGFEVLQKLRAESDVPVVVLSARHENVEKAMRLGANDFLPKPFELDEVVRRIEAALDHRAPRGS